MEQSPHTVQWKWMMQSAPLEYVNESHKIRGVCFEAKSEHTNSASNKFSVGISILHPNQIEINIFGCEYTCDLICMRAALGWAVKTKIAEAQCERYIRRRVYDIQFVVVVVVTKCDASRPVSDEFIRIEIRFESHECGCVTTRFHAHFS